MNNYTQLSFPFSFFFLNYFVYGGVLPARTYVHCMCAVLLEAGRGHQSP